MIFDCEVLEVPKPQKQTRFFGKNGKTFCYDPSSKDKSRIQWHIKPHAPKTPFACPVEMSIYFYMPIPKSASRKKREAMISRMLLPDIRPDEDNLAYLVTNALKGIVYDDDKRIVEKHVFKFYDPIPRTRIIVRPKHCHFEEGKCK